MATREFEQDGQTHAQKLYRMGATSPAAPRNTPVVPGEGMNGDSAGTEIAGTRVAPNGRFTDRANRYAAGFVRRTQGAAALVQQMNAPPPAASGEQYQDINANEALKIYERLRGRVTPEQQTKLDAAAARLRDENANG